MTAHEKYGNVAGRIRSVRQKRGLTQAAMAENLGVSQKTISRIEKGETQPDFSLLMAIHEKFDVPAQWLITGKEAAPGRLSDFFSEEVLARAVKAALRAVSSEAGYEAAGAMQLPLFDIEGGEGPVVYEGDLPGREAPRRIAAPPDLDDAFACQLHGDSMTPEFHDGDILIFSPLAELTTGDYACVHLADRSTFRQVFFLDDKQHIRLVALNRSYLEEQLPRSDVPGLFKLVWKMSKY